jgi:hypothetical protein
VVDHIAPAPLRALYIPEILENILSFLPDGLDLIAASKVNRMFYDCIVTSPGIQDTLFLRPSTKPIPQGYTLERMWVDNAGFFQESMALGLNPTAGMH